MIFPASQQNLEHAGSSSGGWGRPPKKGVS